MKANICENTTSVYKDIFFIDIAIFTDSCNYQSKNIPHLTYLTDWLYNYKT